MEDAHNKIKIVDSKEERFCRLAEQRVNGILDKLRLLGQLANRRNYSYEQDQVDTIFRAINREMRSTKARFGQDSALTKKFRL